MGRIPGMKVAWLLAVKTDFWVQVGVISLQ